MQTLYSLLYVELGLSFQPLQEQYIKYGGYPFLDENALGKLAMFDMHIVVTDQLQEFPWEGDHFIMQVLIRARYTSEALSCLNRVRVSLQLLFMLDILTASSKKVCADILLHRSHGEAWSKMRWPNK
jgi:hypothetical protein